MIFLMKEVFKSLFSPRLYKLYNDGPLDTLYQPQGLEKWCDKVIISAHTILNISLYTSPLICLYVYKRGLFSLEECKALAPYFGSFGMFLALSFMLRAYGRATNPKYMAFLRTLDRKPNQTYNSYMAAIHRYDFDFTAWPVSYEMDTVSKSWVPESPFKAGANDDLPVFQRATIQLLAFIATHTFALRLIYPGSLGLIHQFLWMPLFHGRSSLVQTYNGQRAKVKTADGNFIDTMFVDNRLSNPNGGYLVVCCEGNSGFYEVGIMTSPIKAGYSALGWNHPGFAESTGVPYPSQEHHAIDAVMQYAINKLQFKPENIVMFGWSIGGYSAAWAATNYPVKGVVLDATFDDLLPLARNQMPTSWSLLVKEVVRSYVNLHVSEVLKCYTGPVHLIRRTDDEIICLTPGNHATNRANQLLIDIIKHRHPDVARDHQAALIRYTNMLAAKRPTPESATDDAIVLKYLSDYMTDVQATHCVPLPHNEFRVVMNRMLKAN